MIGTMDVEITDYGEPGTGCANSDPLVASIAGLVLWPRSSALPQAQPKPRSLVQTARPLGQECWRPELLPALGATADIASSRCSSRLIDPNEDASIELWIWNSNRRC
jgi:hypothetical protein